MNEQSTLPSFLELATLFEKIQLNKHPSQIHGLLCGYLCGPSRDLNLLWHIIFENKPESPELRHLLQEWVEIIDRELIAFEFDIILVLPEDEADINLRAESLGLWCQGFITGLEKNGIPIKNRNPSEMTEALDDIIEIAKISFGEIPANEEDEAAYLELVEYVRLSVVMIFQELRSNELPQKLH